MFLGVLPLIYARFFLKQPFASIGLTAHTPSVSRTIITALFSLGMAAAIIALLFWYASLMSNYTLSVIVREEFWMFLLYEFGIVLLFAAVYQFFFNGFILSQLRPKLSKVMRITLITLFFYVFILLQVDSENFLRLWEYMPFLVFAPFAAVIADNSRSVVYPTVVVFTFHVLVDIFVLFMQ
jgi:hypothetical protein